MSRHHLHIKDETGLAVEIDVLLGRLVTAGDGRYILEPDGSAGDGVGEDDLLLQLILGEIRDDDLQNTLYITLAADGTEPLHRQLGLEHRGVDPVAGERLGIDGDGYLFGLLTHDPQLTHLRDGTEGTAHFAGVLLQLTRTAFVTLHGDEQRRGVAEIIDESGLEDTGRHLGLLQERQSRTDLRPCFLVIDVDEAQHDIDIRDAVLGDAVGQLFVHHLKGVDVVLEREGNLLLHFARRSPRIERDYETLTDGKLRELIFVHPRQGPDAESHQSQK